MKEIAQVAIPVADLGEAEDFYSNVLRLDHLFSAPNVVACSLGPTRILLTLRSNYVAPDEAGILIYFEVAGLENEHAQLVQRGVCDGGAPHVVARMGNTEVWIAFIRDPFGNLLGLIEERVACSPVETDGSEITDR